MVIMDERKRGERGTEDRRRLVYTAPVNNLMREFQNCWQTLLSADHIANNKVVSISRLRDSRNSLWKNGPAD